MLFRSLCQDGPKLCWGCLPCCVNLRLPECHGSCFAISSLHDWILTTTGTSWYHLDAFKDSFEPRSLYCLYRAQTSLEAQAGTFWSSQHFDCGKPVIAEHWNAMNSCCCSAVLDVFLATGWDAVDHKEFEAKRHGSGIRQQNIEEADDLVKGATRVLQSKSPQREQLSFHLLWKLFLRRNKSCWNGLSRQKEENRRKWWVGIVFELWRSLLVGKADMLCSCCWHCVLGHTSTWPGLFKTRYPVSTNLSREAELQALPERWCSGFKLFFFTLLMVQHHYGLAGKMGMTDVLWVVFDCRLFEKSWEEFMQIFRLRWRGIGDDRSRVACMSGEELHPATEEFYNPWWSRWTSRGRGSGWGLGVLHIPCENLMARQRDATKSQDRPDAPAPFEPFLTCHFKSVMIGWTFVSIFIAFIAFRQIFRGQNQGLQFV